MKLSEMKRIGRNHPLNYLFMHSNLNLQQKRGLYKSVFGNQESIGNPSLTGKKGNCRES